MERAQIGGNGRIVIPASYRKAMGIKSGDVLTIRMDEEGLHIQSRQQAIRRAQAIVREYVPKGVSLVDEFIAARRTEAKNEQGGG